MNSSSHLSRVAPSFPRIRFVPLLALIAAAPVFAQMLQEGGIEVLGRGPVHEAFAQVSLVGPTAGVVIMRAPYEPIPELPPELRPEGPNVAWIPGYWSWEEDRDDFIWVSGVWRVIPPNREWVPGYWAPAGNGVRWISGFWREVNQVQVVYLPPPPETIEVGPSSPSPGPEYIWAPGCWLWRESRYHWRPGYWVPVRPDWVWVPAYYAWTPRGCVYVPGYWDYELRHRGVMFAPVHYRQPIFRRAGYYYSPAIVIDLGVITAHIFVQPRTCHYYFGDYYDRRYEERGFYPWHAIGFRQYADDPLYAHFRYRQLQQDPNWDAHIADRFKRYREETQTRPPRTLDLNPRPPREGGPGREMLIGRPLAEAVENRVVPLRFRSISMDERRKVETRGLGVRQLQTERARTEAPRAAESGDQTQSALETPRPVRARIPASPVAARSFEGAQAPPPRPPAPETSTIRREVDTPAPVTTEPMRRRTPSRSPEMESPGPAQPAEQRTIRKPEASEPRTIAPEDVRLQTPPERRRTETGTVQRGQPRAIRAPEATETQPVTPNPVLRQTTPRRMQSEAESAPSGTVRRRTPPKEQGVGSAEAGAVTEPGTARGRLRSNANSSVRTGSDEVKVESGDAAPSKRGPSEIKSRTRGSRAVR